MAGAGKRNKSFLLNEHGDFFFFSCFELSQNVFPVK